jgi:peptide/nickel transport system permease protein
LGAIGGAVDGVAGSILNTPINWVSVTINLVPLLPLLILIAAVVGPGNLSLGLVLGLLGWTNLVPLVRARIRAARRYYTQRPSNEPVNVFDEADPVETQVGQQPVWQDSGTRIFGDLVLIAIYGVAINLAAFLIIDASLGFLGLGVQPPTPSWGGMLANAGQFLRQSPDLVVIPGLVLTIMVFCLTIIAERIRDTFTFLTEA